MNSKLSWRIGGLFIFFVYMKLYFTGWDNKWGVQITPTAAFFLASIGIIFFVFSFFLPSPQKNKKFVICTNCKEKYPKEHVKIPVCPKCNGKLVDSDVVGSDRDNDLK